MQQAPASPWEAQVQVTLSNVRLLHCSISASAEASGACMFPWVLLLSLRCSKSVLCSQVRGYVQHLSKMQLTVPQLRETGIGKRIKRFSRWNDLRVKTSGQPQDSVGEVAECGASSSCALLLCVFQSPSGCVQHLSNMV